MKWRIISASITMAALFLTLVFPAWATLITFGSVSYNGSSYNLIYDNNSPFGSIVWLDYSHDPYNPETQNHYPNIYFSNDWAKDLNSALTYTLDPGYNVSWVGDWRLPKVDNSVPWQSNTGYNIITSELGHLYYTELGNKGAYDTSGNPQSGYGLLNTGPFNNLETWYYGTGGGDSGFKFSIADGWQGPDCETEWMGGLAVRFASVTPVPDPSTFVLFGAGLSGIGLMRSRMKK